MCGIAGIIDLTGKRQPDPAALQNMAEALWHRGPDDDGFLVRPGFGFANRRLSIIGLGDGKQPIFNEDGNVAVVYNGELFDYPERKAELQAKGHVFRTHTDTEIIVHLYEEYGEGVFEQLRGQFALALVDLTKRTIFLARDRVGICPLHWSRARRLAVLRLRDQGAARLRLRARRAPTRAASTSSSRSSPWARAARCSKACSRFCPATTSRSPSAATASRPRSSSASTGTSTSPTRAARRTRRTSRRLIDEFEATFRRAVEVRLRADVPVVGYLSAAASIPPTCSPPPRSCAAPRCRASPSRFPARALTRRATRLFTARAIGCQPTILRSDSSVIANTYPQLIASADCPVIDTSCAALWRLSQEVHDQGYKVALTGEGSDEAFAGYVWFKLRKLSYFMDVGGSAPATRSTGCSACAWRRT